MMQGRLIVLEGVDGSGKSTQYALLRSRLAAEGRDFRAVKFPRYDQDSSALIRAYLAGAYGDKPGDVNPYAASVFYAVDRFASFRTDWGAYYQEGGLVLCDRYTTSNAVHQGSKLPAPERGAFLDWLTDLEYGKLGLPAPDLVLWLDVDGDVSRRQRSSRERAGGPVADIHERDQAYLARCLEAGRFAAAHCGWRAVDCAPGGVMRPAEDIAAELYAAVRALLA